MAGRIFCDSGAYSLFTAHRHDTKPRSDVQPVKPLHEARPFFKSQAFRDYADGYAQFIKQYGKRYYRHGNVERVRPCPRPKGGSFIPADVLEENVIRQLFELFGDPKAVAKAIEAATPNPEQNAELKLEREEMLKRLEENKEGTNRITKAIRKGVLTIEDADPEMVLQRQTAEELQQRLTALNTQLENVPDPDAVREVANKIARSYSNPKLVAKYSYHSNLSWDEQRQLLELVFGGTTADGKRMGVYIYWKEGKQRSRRWTYSIVGTINETKLIPRSLAVLKKLDEFDPAHDLGENDVVVQSASHSRAPGPHARRSPSPAARPLRESKQSLAASAPPSKALW
jgi:hypothetical protein